jgi:hypothetical protein
MTIQPKPSLEWTKGMTEQEKEEFLSVLAKSTFLARRLKTLLQERLLYLDRKENGEKVYENQAWPFYQADVNGGKREVKYLLSLFDHIKE